MRSKIIDSFRDLKSALGVGKNDAEKPGRPQDDPQQSATEPESKDRVLLSRGKVVSVRTGKVHRFFSHHKPKQPRAGHARYDKHSWKKKDCRPHSEEPGVRVVEKDGVTYRYRTAAQPTREAPRRLDETAAPSKPPSIRADELEQSLRKASADPGMLQIRSADRKIATSRHAQAESTGRLASALRRASRVITPADASPAIIGFDFGTAFTKVIVQWRDRHYPIDWSDAVDTSDRFLLPTCFYEQADGTLALGRGPLRSTKGRIVEGIKLRLLEWERGPGTSLPESATDAAAFMALALRYVISKFEQTARKQKGSVS